MKKTLRIVALAMVVLMMSLALVSCGGPAKDPSDALDALKENDYAAAKDTTIVPTALKFLGVDGVDTVVSGTGKDDDGNYQHVTIIYFEDKDAANEAWEEVEEYANDKKDDDASEWVVKKSGAMIYYGTPDGIKAAK